MDESGIHSLKLTASLPLKIGRLTPQKVVSKLQPTIFQGAKWFVSGKNIRFVWVVVIIPWFIPLVIMLYWDYVRSL